MLELGLEGVVGPMEDLMQADEIFCSTTTGGVMPCARMGNVTICDNVMAGDAPVPNMLRPKRLYWDKHAAGWHAKAVQYGDPDHPLI